MILVADGWRRCALCRRFKPLGKFNAKARRPDGSVRLWQSYCKPCVRKRNRELNGWKPRRRMSEAQRAKREIEKREAYEERLLADPERHAEVMAVRRMNARLYRDRQRGGPPRPYPQRKTKCGVPVMDAYRPPSKKNSVPAEPLRLYLRKTYVDHGWTPAEINARLGPVLHPDTVRQILNQSITRVSLEFADRVVTLGLGRPDLLNSMYPVETR